MKRFVLAFCVLFPLSKGFCEEGPFIAYSLREASRLAASGSKSADLWNLGGITRILGLVWTEDDAIIVGKAFKGLCRIRLEDLAIGLRMRLLHNEWPIVSIDITKETAKTGKQKIFISQGIRNTIWAQDLLANDIYLKYVALEKTKIPQGLISYVRRCASKIKERILSEGASVKQCIIRDIASFNKELKSLTGKPFNSAQPFYARFLFTCKDPFVYAFRPGVFCIRELKIIVIPDTEKVKDRKKASIFKTAGGLFAQDFARCISTVARREFLRLRRLKAIFDCTALSDVILHICLLYTSPSPRD